MEPMRFPCAVCGATLKTKDSLTNHRRRLHERPAKRFRCSQCALCFTAKLELCTHLFVHNDVKPFPCSLCPSTFRSSGHLNLHFRHAHEHRVRPKNFKCCRCLKAFEIRSTLTKHLETYSDEKRFVCPICFTRLKTRNYYQHHLRLHSKGRPFRCRWCNQAFKTAPCLKAHEQGLHASGPKHNCGLCSAFFKRESSLKKHLRIRHSSELRERFVCATCKCSFLNKTDLSIHFARGHHSAASAKPAVCVRCSKAFSNTFGLNRHVKRSHNPTLLHHKLKTYVCSHCPASFRSRPGIVCHLANLHCAATQFIQCELCPKSFVYIQHLKKHVNDVHSSAKVSRRCAYCEEAFANFGSLRLHQLRVHDAAFREDQRRKADGKSPFRCAQCALSFFCRSDLTMHLQCLCSVVCLKLYACRQCSATFKSKHGLKNHIMNHEEDLFALKSFFCQLCSKSFKTARVLRTHQQSHENARSFACPSCSAAFNTKPGLRDHVNVCHTAAESRIFKCPECDKRFPSSAGVKSHLRAHSAVRPFKCEGCPATFRQRSQMQRHFAHRHVVKSPRQRFACTKCSLSFTKASFLEKHARAHISRPYTCAHCGLASFKEALYLRRHIREHSKVKPFRCCRCAQSFRKKACLSSHMHRQHH